MSFGFTGSELEEQIWILRLIEAALSDGAELEERNQALNGFIQDGTWPDSPVLEQQMQQTAHSLSQAMLYWKFVQGSPWWVLWEAHGMPFACGVYNDMPRSNTAADF